MRDTCSPPPARDPRITLADGTDVRDWVGHALYELHESEPQVLSLPRWSIKTSPASMTIRIERTPSTPAYVHASQLYGDELAAADALIARESQHMERAIRARWSAERRLAEGGAA